MADDRATRFDPRFDPAFQPGYDSRNDPAAAARGGAYGVAGQPGARAGGLLRPAPPSATPEPESLQHVTRDSPVVDRPADVAAEAHDDRASISRAGRNPFELALWVIAAVLLIAGFSLMRLVVELNSGLQAGTAPADAYLFVQLSLDLTPFLVSLGLATAIALLFGRSRRWEARRAE